MTVTKVLFASLAVMALSVGCGKTASKDTRSSEAPKAGTTSDSSDSKENEGYPIEGNGMSFEMALPDAGEVLSLDDVAEEDPVAPPPEETPTSVPDEAGEPEAILPVAAHVQIECKGERKHKKHKSLFTITLVKYSGDDKETEEATASNCGRAVDVKIVGLESGVKYQLRALYVIKDRKAFEGESEVFTTESKRVKLGMRRADLPEWKDVDVDVVFEGEEGEEGEGEIICPADFKPTACWAKVETNIECIKAPCPMAAALPLFALGKNKCWAMERLKRKAEHMSLKLDPEAIVCEFRPNLEESGADGGGLFPKPPVADGDDKPKKP